MTNDIAAARESARQSDGRFGTQLHDETELDLIAENTALCAIHEETEAAYDDEAQMLGAFLTPMPRAAAQRELAEGTRIQAFRFGQDEQEPDDTLRVVVKQSSHQMLTQLPDGRQSSLDWRGTTVERDANGTLVVRNNEGTPLIAYRVLNDGDEPATVPPTHPDLRMRYVEARSQDPAVLADVATSAIPMNRVWVADNLACPTSTLDRLAGDPSVLVRRAVASNPNTSPVVLAQLAHDDDTGTKSGHTPVGLRVAINKSAPATALRTLASTEEPRVLVHVAYHANTPPDVLEKLAEHPSHDVHHAVASNPHTPGHVLARWERGNGFVMDAVAKNPATPADVLERLAEGATTRGSARSHTRAMVASNPSAPRHVMDELVGDSEAWVRQHAASNPAIAPANYDRLTRDDDEHVRAALASNEAIPERMRRRFKTDPSGRVRNAFIRSSAATPQDLLDLTYDESPAVRRAAAAVLNRPQA